MTDDTLQLSPEIRSLMGVYALYWMLDDAVERMDQAPRIGRLESRILIRLDRPRRMGALAQLLLTGPPSVTAAADRLEEMGLVQRLPDPDDRRALLLHLTDQGRAVRGQLDEEARRLFRQVSGLSTDEIAQFAALCEKIHDTSTGNGAPLGCPDPKGDRE